MKAQRLVGVHRRAPPKDRARPLLNELSGDEIGADKAADRKSG